MFIPRTLYTVAILAVLTAAHQVRDQTTFSTFDAVPGVNKEEPWSAKFGSQEDLQFTGPLSFSHLPYHLCLSDVSHSQLFDIAILGFPFDTTTTYRPGARFGPFAIRSGSRRQTAKGYTLNWSGAGGPRELGANIVDCGDVSTKPNFC
jgi:agmatinase